MSIKLPAAWFPLALVGLSGLGLGLFIGHAPGIGRRRLAPGPARKKGR